MARGDNLLKNPAAADLLGGIPIFDAVRVIFLQILPQRTVLFHRVNVAFACRENVFKIAPTAAHFAWRFPRRHAAASGVTVVLVPDELAVVADRVHNAFAAAENLLETPTVANFGSSSQRAQNATLLKNGSANACSTRSSSGRIAPVFAAIVEAVVSKPQQLVVGCQRVETVAARRDHIFETVPAGVHFFRALPRGIRRIAAIPHYVAIGANAIQPDRLIIGRRFGESADVSGLRVRQIVRIGDIRHRPDNGENFIPYRRNRRVGGFGRSRDPIPARSWFAVDALGFRFRMHTDQSPTRKCPGERRPAAIAARNHLPAFAGIPVTLAVFAIGARISDAIQAVAYRRRRVVARTCSEHTDAAPEHHQGGADRLAKIGKLPVLENQARVTCG